MHVPLGVSFQCSGVFPPKLPSSLAFAVIVPSKPFEVAESLCLPVAPTFFAFDYHWFAKHFKEFVVRVLIRARTGWFGLSMLLRPLFNNVGHMHQLVARLQSPRRPTPATRGGLLFHRSCPCPLIGTTSAASVGSVDTKRAQFSISRRRWSIKSDRA
jgi:hypothetical protein